MAVTQHGDIQLIASNSFRTTAAISFPDVNVGQHLFYLQSHLLVGYRILHAMG